MGVFAVVSDGVMPAYAAMSSNSPEVIREVIVYGRIVCVASAGLYYKWQTFFFITLGALQTCIVPILSYNYAARQLDRVRQTLAVSLLFGAALMAVGTLCFELLPAPMLRVFTADPEVIRLGTYGFRRIGPSFLPMVTSLLFPVFFQAVGQALKSSLLTVIRTVVLFVPLGYLFSRLGLERFWLTFICTEVLTSVVGFAFYRQFLQHSGFRENDGYCAARD